MTAVEYGHLIQAKTPENAVYAECRAGLDDPKFFYKATKKGNLQGAGRQASAKVATMRSRAEISRGDCGAAWFAG